MRVPVVDKMGRPLMPCTPPKARLLLKTKQATHHRNKLGIFYIRLTYEVPEPSNQTLVVGIDPGSKFEGYSVVGTEETVLNIMAEAPNHVKDAVETRRNMRRARPGAHWARKCWRRPSRNNNRLARQNRIPPSTRSRWEAKARIVAQLCKILPLTDAAVEDVCAQLRKGTGGKWNQSFSPVQVGKEHLYKLLRAMGLQLHVNEGWQTKEWRERYHLKKTKQKDKQAFDSHAVDAWVMAANVSGASQPRLEGNRKRLYYTTEIRQYRRQLHRLKPEKGGKRKPYGGTRSQGLRRGTLLFHPKYFMASVGGTLKGQISLHAYRDNKRLTQRAKVDGTITLTYTPYRASFV